MAIDERSRHELYLRLEEVLGEPEATALMEHLPPAGWADVARRQDVEAVTAALRLEIAASADRVTATVRAEMNEQLRTMVLAMVGTNVTLAALAFGAANLV